MKCPLPQKRIAMDVCSIGVFVSMLLFLLVGTNRVLAEDIPAADAKPEARGDVADEAREKAGEDRPLGRAALIHCEGLIAEKLERFVMRRIEDALAAQADTIILEIDSPGGRVDTTFNIVERIRHLKSIRTVAYVRHEAISGGSLLALACDQVIMHPAARLGDCGPVFLDENFMFRHAPEKFRSDLAVRVRELAEAKRRSPALLEAMVDMNLVVFSVLDKETGKTIYLSDAELQSQNNPDRFEKGAPVFESRVGSFLTVTGTRAKDLGMADIVIESKDELWKTLHVVPPKQEWRMTWVDATAYVFSWTSVSILLIIVGLLAVYIELCSPGIGVGAGVATLCFTLFFWSRFLGGTSSWLEVILFGLGIVLLGLELFVIPGFGVTGIAGFLLIVGSLTMASQEFLIPHSTNEWRRLGDSLAMVAMAGVGSMCGIGVLSRYWKSITFFQAMSFMPPMAGDLSSDLVVNAPKSDDAKDEKATKSSASCVCVGEWGTAETPLCPAGKARFGRAYVDVVTSGDFVERGQPIRILEIHGNRITVTTVE